MRFEALHVLAIGAAAYIVALGVSRVFPNSKLRTVLLALLFAVTLGMGIIPGHGEVVLVPVLGLLIKGGVATGIGVFYLLVWWSIALAAASLRRGAVRD